MDFQCDFPALGPTISPSQGEIKGAHDVILLQTKKKDMISYQSYDFYPA